MPENTPEKPTMYVCEPQHPNVSRFILKTIFSLLLIFIILGSIFYVFIFRAPQMNATVTLTVEPGQSAVSISKELKSEGLVRSSLITQTLIVFLGGARKIQAGLYSFSQPENIFEVASRLVRGDLGYIPVRLTVPEGTDSHKLAMIISDKFPNANATSVERIAKSKEGYLFPETYFFAPFTDPMKIIDKMSETFSEKIKAYDGEIKASGKSLDDVIKVASLLEEEVQTKEDKAKVADIIWRRLSNDMPLQLDSTLGYVLHKTSAELTLQDLHTDNPFNSYIRRGLPPTPISNPGIDSILATIHPIPNHYLFYLSDKDGITHFAITYAEHLKNKQKYLK